MNLRSSVGNIVGADFRHLIGLGRRPAKAEEAPPEEEKPEGEAEEEEEKPEGAEGEQAPPEEETPEDEEKPDAAAIAAEARAAERARCRAIFAAPEAAGNVALAAYLAFDTDQTAEQAVATLKLGGKSGGLGARMATAPNPALGAGDTQPASRQASLAAGWDAAFKRAGIATNPKA